MRGDEKAKEGGSQAQGESRVSSYEGAELTGRKLVVGGRRSWCIKIRNNEAIKGFGGDRCSTHNSPLLLLFLGLF